MRLIFFTILMTICLGSLAQQPLMPQVQKFTAKEGFISIGKTSVVHAADTSCKAEVALLNTYLGSFITFNPDAVPVEIATDPSYKDEEGYTLVLEKPAVRIKARNSKGVFYALQTLIQLGNHYHGTIPAGTIEDAPRFAYRGLMLDVSRHFFGVNFIKQLLDVMAMYKLNTFHWHLTDDQGWRIEINKYPRLQVVAAWRDQTLIGHKKDIPHQFDGKKYGGYYTQAQVKDIVAYAQSKHIDIIPEIEMPGHASAALAAYPYLGCTGGPYETAQFWGIFDDVYCAGNDSTFTFLEDVLDEVIPLFPGKYIHIGGDECPKNRWNACPRCQQRMAAEHLEDAHALQSYFVKRIEKYLNSKGKQLIGWDEITEGGLSPNATVMCWRGDSVGFAAAAQGHDVIFSPEKNLYFDYYQSTSMLEPIAAGGYTPLEKVYSYDPMQNKQADAGGDSHILGIQANLWSEYLPTEDQAWYMLFPRLLALSEIAWLQPSSKDYASFYERWKLQRAILDKHKIKYADIYDEITGKMMAKGSKHQLSLHSSLPNATIRYSYLGKEQTYEHPIDITASGIIKAQLYVDDKAVLRPYTKEVIQHKAVGKKISLKNPGKGNFDVAGSILLNGQYGTNRYNDGQWLGLSGDNLQATIDLGKETEVNQIKTSFLDYHWQRMWKPVSYTFEYSNNGKHFRKLSGEGSEKDLVYEYNCKKTKTRYIRVTLENKGIIPQGEYGAGGKAWLLVDEIAVY